MSHSTELMTLRDMVCDLSTKQDAVRNGRCNLADFADYFRDLFRVIDEVLATEDLRESVWGTRDNGAPVWTGPGDGQETKDAITTLRVARAHRNSLCFQGGDFDFYLSCQDPWDALSCESSFGHRL